MEPITDPRDVGKFFKDKIKERGLLIKDVAERISADPSYMSHLLSGRVSIVDSEYFSPLVRELGLTVDEVRALNPAAVVEVAPPELLPPEYIMLMPEQPTEEDALDAFKHLAWLQTGSEDNHEPVEIRFNANGSISAVGKIDGVLRVATLQFSQQAKELLEKKVDSLATTVLNSDPAAVITVAAPEPERKSFDPRKLFHPPAQQERVKRDLWPNLAQMIEEKQEKHPPLRTTAWQQHMNQTRFSGGQEPDAEGWFEMYLAMRRNNVEPEPWPEDD